MINNLEEIKAKADILSVVEHFIPLHKSGGMFKANCPFHDEKTPSFFINQNKNMFYCFGCQKGGDAFKFVELYEHTNFNEAIRKVANICNIAIIETQSENFIKKNSIFEMLNAINDHLQENLLNNEAALQYLNERGLNIDDIKKFDLGLWKDGNELAFYLRGLNMLDLALKFGVLYKNKDNSGYFLPLQNRLNFAIRNFQHKIVGFSGRFLGKNENNEAKYINSKESEIYKKSFILYNLSNAKSEIFNKKEVIICEGYFDVIANVKLGYKNAIATCGTAFTLSHLALLLKFCQNLTFILSFDKDKAGEMANLRALKMLFKEGIFSVKVRYLKKKAFKDFGDLLKYKDKINGEITDEFIDYDGFLYFCKMNLKNINDDKNAKFAFFNELKTLINAQQNFYLKDELINRACEYLECNKSEFLDKTPKIETKKENDFLEKIILKNILTDEKNGVLAREYLTPLFFKYLNKNFEAFLNGDDTLNYSIIMDENLKTLNELEFRECLKHLIKENLNEQLQRAKEQKNIKLIVSTMANLRKLE